MKLGLSEMLYKSINDKKKRMWASHVAKWLRWLIDIKESSSCLKCQLLHVCVLSGFSQSTSVFATSTAVCADKPVCY